MPEVIQEPGSGQQPQPSARKVSRRQMLMTFGIALNAVAGVLFAMVGAKAEAAAVAELF